MLITCRKTLHGFSSSLSLGTESIIVLLYFGSVASWALRAESLELAMTCHGCAEHKDAVFRPGFNNVSVEFVAVPSFLCGQMSWSLFELGRRMFEENLYDAIPSIIELFLYNLHSFGSLAVEGSVFLLVKKH